MPNYFFNILVHDSLMTHLRGKDKSLRNLLQKTLERLQLGEWGGGTRVKLLKGVSKPVYEARINLSLRLLFTVCRGYATKPPHDLQHYLLAWDIVDHDHIDRAKRLNLQPETGFLDMDERASLDLQEPPLAPEAIIEDELNSSQDLACALNSDSRINRTADELVESIRWFELDPELVIDEDEWQNLLDDNSVGDLELKLSLEQAESVFLPGPVLLRGTAGSGKTTVCVYRLARAVAENPLGQHLFVTYSEPLRNSAKRLFEDLFRARRLDLPERMPEFLTFPEFYRRMTKGYIEGCAVLRFPVFEGWYTTIYNRSDAALAWEEIRGIIKGACIDLHKPGLTYAEYDKLGRKRAPLFSEERPRLYKVYEKYAAWCKDQRRVDDIDLARAALRQLEKERVQFDQIICDEGQDLTELELDFLLKLVRHEQGLFFAADPQQIVNPSGFRWAEIRSLIRRETPSRTAPEITTLSRNFRSVHAIVSLANALLTLQRERTGRSDDDALQETTLHGASPVLVSGNDEAVLEQIRGFGPRCAVITATPEEAEKLRKHLDSERVFDIAASKGLEFDGCVLWNLLGHDPEVWRDLLVTDIGMKEDPVARRAIHHVYVGVTRARRYLGLYESRPEVGEYWQIPPLRSQVEQDEPDALAKFMVFAATPAEWDKEGNYFFERSRFRQAAECYRRAGNERHEKLSIAAHYAAVEAWEKAARLYMALGDPEKAAPCFEAARSWKSAADCYFKVRLWQRAGICYEQGKDLKQAAQAFQNANAVQDYRRCLRAQHEADRNYLEAAKIAVKQQDFAGAASLYERAGHKDQAAQYRLQAASNSDDYAVVAQLHEKQGHWTKAAEAYRQDGDDKNADRCLAIAAEKDHDFAKAEALWQALGEVARAHENGARVAEVKGQWLAAAGYHHSMQRQQDMLRCLKKSTDPQAASWLEAVELEVTKPIPAARLYYQLELLEDARRLVEIYMGERPVTSKLVSMVSETHREEMLEAKKLHNLLQVHELMAQKRLRDVVAFQEWPWDRERFELQAAVAEEIKDFAAAAKHYQEITEHAKAAECFSKAGKPVEAAYHFGKLAERDKDYAKAASWFQKAGRHREMVKNQARAAEQEGKLNQAIQLFTEAGMTAQASRCRRKFDKKNQPELPLD